MPSEAAAYTAACAGAAPPAIDPITSDGRAMQDAWRDDADCDAAEAPASSPLKPGDQKVSQSAAHQASAETMRGERHIAGVRDALYAWTPPPSPDLPPQWTLYCYVLRTVCIMCACERDSGPGRAVLASNLPYYVKSELGGLGVLARARDSVSTVTRE